MTRVHLSTILVTVLFLIFPSMAIGAIVLVGPARPISTIGDGFAVASDGDTIVIEDGIYNESLVVTKRVTFQAQ